METNSHVNVNANRKNSKIHDIDIDIENCMKNVNKELGLLGYSLESRVYIANIINIMDKLASPMKFNKTLFFHILEYANIDKENNILLNEFFQSFFTVYESMKRNRKLLSDEIKEDQEKLSKTHHRGLRAKKDFDSAMSMGNMMGNMKESGGKILLKEYNNILLLI